MKFLIDDEFAGLDLVAYEALWFDEPFNQAVGATQQLGRELVRLDRTPGRVVRHVRFEPLRDPGSAAGQAFGTTRASFLEELDYNLAAHRGQWRTVPNLLPDRVVNAGELELTATPAGVRRIVRGEVRARLFGLGGLVERSVVAEIVKSYARTTDFTRAWLAR